MLHDGEHFVLADLVVPANTPQLGKKLWRGQGRAPGRELAEELVEVRPHRELRDEVVERAFLEAVQAQLYHRAQQLAKYCALRGRLTASAIRYTDLHDTGRGRSGCAAACWATAAVRAARPALLSGAKTITLV